MKGYTLIELIIAVTLLVIILLGGTTLFYQNLKATGLSDIDSNLNNSIQNIVRAIERDIRFSEVTGIGILTRADCQAEGTNGVSGSSLSVTDLNGLSTVYSLDSGKVASTSAETGRIIYLNPSYISVKTLTFTWYCYTNSSDKIKIDLDAESTILNSGIKVERNVTTEINLLNSGLN